MSFHPALLGPTGGHWLDDPPDVSSVDSTRQYGVDDARLSCKQQVGGSSPPASSQNRRLEGCIGDVTASATSVWLLGSFAVLSLHYRTPAPADPGAAVEDQSPAGGEPSKRERAHASYAALVAAGQPVTGARLAEAAGISASYGRALLAEFQADSTLTAPAQANGQRPSVEVGER
jgi:hypothetical protein